MNLPRRPEFDTEAIEDGATTVLSLRGELDLLCAPQMTAELELALARRPATLAIDLRRVAFMDSTGVHAIISAELRCRRQGTRFYLIRGPAAVDRLMAMCGLDRAFSTVGHPAQLPPDETSLPIAV